MSEAKRLNDVTGEQQRSYLVPLAFLTLLFLMWGFITSMNDILIPHFQNVFQLSHLQAMLIQFCFFSAYFIISVIYFFSSIRHGDLISKIGYKKGVILSLLIMAFGCLIFYPAAEFELYSLFLTALFILASGMTLLQIAANPYVALLGKPIPALAISDSSHLSCVSNDFGYDQVFSRYLEALGKKGNVLLAISSSGNSKNVIEAIEVAKKNGVKTIALTGKGRARTAEIADIVINVPHHGFADRIQEIHIQSNSYIDFAY